MKPDPESPEVVFDKTKIASMMRVGNEVLTNIKFNQFKHDGDCFIRNELVIRMEADLYKATIAEKEMTFIFEKPTFLDWLLGRERIKNIKVNIWDVLKNPPLTSGDVTRFYNIEKLD